MKDSDAVKLAQEITSSLGVLQDAGDKLQPLSDDDQLQVLNIATAIIQARIDKQMRSAVAGYLAKSFIGAGK